MLPVYGIATPATAERQSTLHIRTLVVVHMDAKDFTCKLSMRRDETSLVVAISQRFLTYSSKDMSSLEGE